MSILLVTGTGTDVGKTMVTAALACTHGPDVAVVKPAQTGVQPGDPGDLAEVTRLSGCTNTYEFARYPDPLSPHAAARTSGLATLALDDAVERIATLATDHHHVLVEGAGGLLVEFDLAAGGGWTLRDLAGRLDAPVVVVIGAGLGTLNATALTLEALRGRSVAGLVIGSWPAVPELVHRSNVVDLVRLAPLVGVLPAGVAQRTDVATAARDWLSPELGGRFDAAAFTASVHPQHPVRQHEERHD